MKGRHSQKSDIIIVVGTIVVDSIQKAKKYIYGTKGESNNVDFGRTANCVCST